MLLKTDPELVLKLMKGKSLIVYDQISNPWAGNCKTADPNVQ
jgi:hypothetical protein